MSENEVLSSEASTANPTYAHPKTLLLDLDGRVAETLSRSGYNVLSGSLGVPYQVEAKDELTPIVNSHTDLPHYTEQDIIVLNMIAPEPTAGPDKPATIVEGKEMYWTHCRDGIIDPRPLIARLLQSDLNRIFKHGGSFIIFSDYLQDIDMIYGALKRHHGVVQKREVSASIWHLLSILDPSLLDVTDDHGREVTVASGSSPLHSVLARFMEGASFRCSFHPQYYLTERWIPLAFNKYGVPVSGFIGPEGGSGFVLLLPQIIDKASFLEALFREALPELAPRLFPHVTGKAWTRRPEYELPGVLENENQIEEIVEEANRRIEERQQLIERERDEQGYLHDLITETGDCLVAAVKKSLETLGFTSVVDVDQLMADDGDTRIKREDLRIDNVSRPLVLVEVKGVGGFPTEENSLQAIKYIAPRMRELKRTDIRGLAVINHQRHLPALQRNNDTPFQEDIVINAEDQEFGLLTTWDLFRLVRSFLKNGWIHAYVEPLFYSNGRIEPIPTHYEYVGRIGAFMEKYGVIGIQVEGAVIRLGDRIAFELPVVFEEQDVSSLENENNSIEESAIGMLVGTKTHLTKAQAKFGTRVFRVKGNSPNVGGTKTHDVPAEQTKPGE